MRMREAPRRGTVVVVINNDNKTAEIEFDVWRLPLGDGVSLSDRLGVSQNVVIRDGKLRVSLPKRSAAVFTDHVNPEILSKKGPVCRSHDLSFWQIWNMSFGFLGIQFGWGLQLANMSPIYKYLHAEESSLPYLWLAGPITGLIVQPIIGSMSDRTWNRLGRRRPYFLVGAILASIALFFMPDSSALWMAAGYSGFSTLASTSLWNRFERLLRTSCRRNNARSDL